MLTLFDFHLVRLQSTDGLQLGKQVFVEREIIGIQR